MEKIDFNDEYFMKQAYKEAKEAFRKDEVPVGAVIVSKGLVVAKTHNLTEVLNDVTAHAEILAITSAAEALGSKYLNNCTIYVTMEPCSMCAGALNRAQIDRLVFGAYDKERGFSSYSPLLLHPKTEVVAGLMEAECSSLVKEFFAKKRK